MKKVIYSVAAIAILSLLSCERSAQSKNAATEDLQLAPVKETTDAKVANVSESDTTAVDTTSIPPSKLTPQSGSPVMPDWDKKLVKTANVTLELKDFYNYDNSIHQRLRNFGAYIAQEQQSQTGSEISTDISIKVPVDKFEDLMNSLQGDGVKVMEKNISTQDVTDEVVDTKARLEAKKEVRDRYLELLKQANKMKDVIEVQNEINSIQEEIESAASRTNYLTHSAAFSTVNLKYYQYLTVEAPKETRPTFVLKVKDAFSGGASVIEGIVLLLLYVWPLIIGAAILIVVYKKAMIKRNKNTVTKAAEQLP